MPNYAQADRSIQVTTPLGTDVLLLVGLRGQESISRLFHFELDMLAAVDTTISFENILGQSVTAQMTLPNEETRYFNGIVKRFTQGGSDELFTTYHAEVVPQIWLLTKSIQSCIFQNLSVPDILNELLSGYPVTFQLNGTYYPRNYCVQYRESDFDFANRLMEDEGIYYYFSHTDGAHQMIVTDAQTTYPEVATPSSINYEPRHDGVGEDMRIRTWEKAQELRSSQYTLGEYCFETPTGNLEASTPTIDQVQVGTVTHKFNITGEDLEIYEYPAGCAKRYDGLDSSGSTYAQGLTQMSADRTRIVGVRMEEEECAGLEISGTSDCGNLLAGYAFTLGDHPNGDGDYLLTRVEHTARQSGYQSGEKDAFTYDNRFVCMPTGLVYRPRRVTPKPVIAGFQTAIVTGPPGTTTSGQSVYCDQYGRVKVQFYWDREGQLNSSSSCWLRVAQVWAGNGWGSFFWPRIGSEVVVAFEEGDPDQPMIVGNVYNAANMPPYTLPANSALGGIRSASVSGTSSQNFNGVVFNDTLGTEHLAIHSENNMTLNSEGDKQFHGGRHKGERVAGASIRTTGGLPGGGGSGGGSAPFTAGNTMQFQQPFDYSGLDCTAVYGDQVTMTVGDNLTIVLGGMNTTVLNPFGLIPIPPGPLSDLLGGSGILGNNTFTAGATANFMGGLNYSYTLVPSSTLLDSGGTGLIARHNVTEVMSIPVWILLGLLFALTIIWNVLYAGFQQIDTSGANPVNDDDSQVYALVGICQILAGALQAAIFFASALLATTKQATVPVAHATTAVAAVPPPIAPQVVTPPAPVTP